MDFNLAIHFGQLVGAAYAAETNDRMNHAGSVVQAGLGGGTQYKVVASISANDLATDLNPARGNDRVPIGLILQAAGGGEAVIAIRGTEGIKEWVQDAKFIAVPCPFLSSAGHTEDGFTAMYKSMTIDTASSPTPVVQGLSKLPWRGVTSLTICGHSLGGALATLLALDVAANAAPPFNNPRVYTYASPRTGDSQFVTTYDHLVPNTVRIANRMDLVPKLPLPPLYDHVLGLSELNPVKLVPPTVLVKFDIVCEHILTTYMHLLSLQAGGDVIPLDDNCKPS